MAARGLDERFGTNFTALSKLINELGIAAVPHGFRSSFQDWAAERTNTPREVVDAALAHTVQAGDRAAGTATDRRRDEVGGRDGLPAGQPGGQRLRAGARAAADRPSVNRFFIVRLFR